MPSKTIMIDVETYNRLKALKREKSFTEIINELLNRQSMMPIDTLGCLSEEKDKIDYEIIKQSRIDRDVSIR